MKPYDYKRPPMRENAMTLICQLWNVERKHVVFDGLSGKRANSDGISYGHGPWHLTMVQWIDRRDNIKYFASLVNGVYVLGYDDENETK
jgi:hypothetical protein